MQLGARAGRGFVGPPRTGSRSRVVAPVVYKTAPPVFVRPVVSTPVVTAPPVPSPVPAASSIPEISRRFPQPVQTRTRTRTVYAVKKMDRPSPAPGAVVVEPEKKTNWLPLILAAGGAAFFLKG